MSSSRIIKSTDCADQAIADFCFDNFQKAPEAPFYRCGDGFMPFFHDTPLPPPESDEQELIAEPPAAEEIETVPMVRMTEEELQISLQEAFEKGAEEERKRADEDLAGIFSALCEAVSVVSKLKERVVRESEDELLKLAFSVAKIIIRQEIKHDRQILTQLVSEALKGFPEQHEIVVSLNPEDYKVITSNRGLFLAEIGNERQLTLKPDESTTQGGCIVESSTGVIDARIEAQLDEIYAGLVEERSRMDDGPAQETVSGEDEETAP